jgi:hypothetical protein
MLGGFAQVRALQSASAMSPLLIGIIIAGVGVVLAVGGFVIRSRAGRILAVPLGKTADIPRAAGPFSAQGAVRAQQPLAAPCSSTPCVLFELVIEAKVKEKRGGSTQTSWKKVATHRQGSVFTLDDGSGAGSIRGTDEVEGDLEQTFKGAPPGGGGLGSLAGYVTQHPSFGPGAEIQEYRVTERVIRADGTLYTLGTAANGQLGGGGGKKLLVSTRGRDATVGSARMRSLVMFIVGGLAVAGGATVAILRPGEARACGALVDGQKECKITSRDTIEVDDFDGKTTKRRRAEVAWEVTKPGAYELTARDPKKGKALPVIQVEDEIGFPMNIDIGIGIGAGAYSTKTKTRKLEPGKYKIYVFSEEAGPSSLVIAIAPVPAS